MHSRRIPGALLIVGALVASGSAARAQDLYVGPSNAAAQTMADKLLNNLQAQRPVVRRLGALVAPKLQQSKTITLVVISTKCDHYTSMDASFDDGTTQSVPYTDKIAAGDADALRSVSQLIHIVSESCESP